MAKLTSFAHQRAVLEQLLSNLAELEAEFKEVINHHELQVDTLYEEQGLMEETYQDYKATCLQPMKSALTEMLAKIQEESIPFVEKEIDFIASR
ncbi:MAG: hypothetical protein LBN93_08035 [Candidatus Symbiothrix sp.]|jgi:hypothetical protein|nr:hypothetical protein [Candidatus Symbiothrix sp.]